MHWRVGVSQISTRRDVNGRATRWMSNKYDPFWLRGAGPQFSARSTFNPDENTPGADELCSSLGRDFSISIDTMEEIGAQLLHVSRARLRESTFHKTAQPSRRL